MSGFQSVAERVGKEQKAREGISERLLTFGVNYLDTAMHGIQPDDLVLVGAPSGVGKTQFCVNLALRNVLFGRRVHFIALEASKFEIERRMKFQILANLFYKDPFRPKLLTKLNFYGWYLKKHGSLLDRYEDEATKEMQKFESLFTYYKTDSFGVNELVANAVEISEFTDLLIIDHIHYFDLDGENENRAMKEIVMMVRRVCQTIEKPIVLVSHLRKRDKRFTDLVAGLDDFHGSSDLVKIATKVISIGRGEPATDTKFETYFRIAKDRLEGAVTRYIGKHVFDITTGTYDAAFSVGKLQSVKGVQEFAPLLDNEIPFWLRAV